MADITMPQLGETVTEGTITRWFKEVGDQVAADETLFEVSTDKVDSEVPSPVAGFLAEILVPPGGTVPVGATLAVVSDAPPQQAGGNGSAGAEQAPEAPVVPDESGSGEGGPVEPEEARVSEASPPAPDKQQPREAASSTDGARESSRAATGTTRPGRLLSPVVRRLVAEHNLDLDAIEGTGAGGRITRNDVQAAISSGDGRTAPSSRSTPAPSATPPPPAASQAEPDRPARPMAAADGDEIVPFSNIRRRTAEHMTRSKATSAHTLVVMEVDYDGVDRVRGAERARFKAEEGISLTYLPFVSRAVIDALREFPHMNASVGEDHLVLHRDVHLGIAVDLHFEGLMVPVIHGAGEKRLRALARDIAALASLARSRKLGPDDIAGGTFTITNPGPFHTLVTGAIINQPQVAILSTDGVRKRPVAVELADGTDAIAVHPVGNLALTFDHRAVDGAYAAAFVGRMREIIEGRDWAAELA